MNLIAISQFLFGGFSNYRIHMNWINSFHIGVLIQNTSNCSKHIMHWLTKIFPSMGSNKNHSALSYPIKFRVMIIHYYCMLHSINYCIASHINRFWFFSLIQEVFFCQFSWCKIIFTYNSHCLTIKFFWIRTINIISTQASFHMPNSYL